MARRFSLASRLSSSPSRSAAGANVRLWPWALAGVLLGVLATVVFYAPASWLAAAVAQASGGKVVLAQPEGRVWNGSARLLLVPGGQKPVLLPQRLRWTAKYTGLGLQLRLLPECCATRPMVLDLRPGWRAHEARIQDLDMRLPATLLAGLGTPFNTLGFDDSVLLRSPDVKLQLPRAGGKNAAWQLQGQAQMQLLQLSSSLATLPALGSYQVDIAGGKNTEVKLSTLEGALQLQGAGGWRNGHFGFEGQASAALGYEESLANILNVIGQRAGAVSVFRL